MDLLKTDLTKEITIIDAKPILFIKDIKALVIADLHIGTEAIMSEDGTSTPFIQTEFLMKEIQKYLKELHPKLLILNGDIKHSFQEFTKVENRDVKRFLKALSPYVEEIHLVKGNHDLHLNWAIKEINNAKFHKENFEINSYLFLHGDKELPKEINDRVKFIFIGHEHPVFAVKIKRLTKIRAPVFLYGPLKESDKKLIVMPAFTNYSTGTPINPYFTSNLLSPILKEEVNLLNFESFVLNQNEVLHFPVFKQWYYKGRKSK